MSDYIDTREGWRQITGAPAGDEDEIRYRDRDGNVRYWVREEPVPPLPIWAVVQYGGGVDDPPTTWVHTPMGWLQWTDQGWFSPAPEWSPPPGFEVLSEPRNVTAKAVLAEVSDYFDGAWRPGSERLFSYDKQRALFERVEKKLGVDQ